MTKQELINEINNRIEELKEKVEYSRIRKEQDNVDYFKGSLSECYANKYLLETYMAKKDKLIKKKKFLVIHSDKFGRYNTICKANNYEDLLKDWGCFNNTYIDKIYELGDMIYEEKR